MGTAPPAYYTSLLATSAAAFLLISAVCAAEIGLSCYTHSDGALVLLLFLLFGLATLAFTLAMAPLFSNARLAALVGPLLYFLSSQLYSFFLEGGELSDGQALASLLPAMAFYLGASQTGACRRRLAGTCASQMAQYEGSQQGVTWGSVHEGPFPLSASLAFLALDTLLYLALAYYLDAVLANGARDDAPVVEPLAAPLSDRGVVVRSLRKEYPRGVAVEGLSLQLPPDAITCLLGSNGAGKTTTISMLTGLVPPTAGDATIDGRSLSAELRAIRTSIGVCQQVNTIWEELSPTQHLTLFGRLRGLSGGDLAAEVARALQRVGLQERASVRAGALSGGQKRKLCLAVALLGGSRTLFLDEPTSGMDPHSRRAIWALLREQRQGRTVVLTTHFLDEAMRS
ncbi:ATP-binding cassette transporter [Emiliania huxleyi CCMP1516]|uniref:ABC transporter domain-containing protein n=2 Tax=Emiliania huxleyi TaxID=2903 RepID=A0A0D3IZP1_EMIH1|nr:ATP-binding cassette transporter [Emiliania huxleyi CCMP1516]EOD16726.1 ATP-binding cassette transporter [Emiliania huxleyi CCMP1516]|eukprot:XP_005769155.1 ATP-binding cassette transporter [Emiliania huxleyi CCMP1516]